MPIQFDEVSAEIQPETPGAGSASAGAPPAQAAPTGDLREQLEHELRLQAERQARLCAD